MFKSTVERFSLGVEDPGYDFMTVKAAKLTSTMASNSL